nr:hypothetical protein BaRGS_020343 [Batillaria attramentaria]
MTFFWDLRSCLRWRGWIYSIAELVDADMGLYWRLVNMNMYGVYTGFLNVANVLTMVIAIDRCACVLNPLHVRRAIRTRWVAGGIVVLYILILILCSLECFRFTIVSTFDPATNTTRYKSERTQFYYQHRTFLDVINNYVFNVITPTVSLVVVAAATTLTGLRLRTAQAWRQRVSLDLRQSPSGNLTSTTLGCRGPWVAMTITSKVVTGFSPRERYWDLFYVTNTLMHLLASINASVNFLVYVTRGTRFRATVRSLFTRCKPRSQQKGGPGPQTTIPTVTTLSCQ